MNIQSTSKALTGWAAGTLVAALLAAAAGTAGAQAAEAPVPRTIQGVWAEKGRCDLRAQRLTITANRAGWGKGPYDRVYYDPQTRAVFWRTEGVVDNFELGSMPNVLIHNGQGFHMPGAVAMTRCGSKLVRAPWPPRKR